MCGIWQKRGLLYKLSLDRGKHNNWDSLPLHVGTYPGISKNPYPAPQLQHKLVTNHRQEVEPSYFQTKACDSREKQWRDVDTQKLQWVSEKNSAS